MDDRNEMQEGERQSPIVTPMPPREQEESGGRPYRRKLIRPERDTAKNGHVGEKRNRRDEPASVRFGTAAQERDQSGNGRSGGEASERQFGGGVAFSGNGKTASGKKASDGNAGMTGGNGQFAMKGTDEQTAAKTADGQAGMWAGNGSFAMKGEDDGQAVMKTGDGQAGMTADNGTFAMKGEDDGQAVMKTGDGQAGMTAGNGPSASKGSDGHAITKPAAPDRFDYGRVRYRNRRSRLSARSRNEAHAQQDRQSARPSAQPNRRGTTQEKSRARQQGKAHQQEQSQRQGQSRTEDKQPIPASLDELKPMLERDAGLNTSFDVVLREMTFGGRRTALFYMNGLVNSAVLTEVLVRMSYLTPEDIDSDALKLFFETYVPAIQVEKTDSFDDMLDGVFAGNAAMFIDRERAALIIDAKQFPDRTPEEPSLERVVRGSRDGFVETLMTNVSLIRRRLRDKDLRYELIRVGARTKTDVCIAYIRDIADPELVEAVKRKIGRVNVYGLPLADKQLEETTVNLGWHPFPLVRYSERPDVVAAQLLEGSVAVLTDTTPSVMMLPTTYFDLTQHAEENRQTPFIGTYLRWVRYIGILFSLFLLPLWFLLVLKPELKPPALDFIGPQQMGRIPLFLQFVLAEIGVDLMRMAAVHTPSPLSTAMSLIAAILIGDIAVKTGLFNNEVILYMAVAAIGMFATPNYELGLANRIVRLALIIAVAAFGVPGFVVGTALFIVLLACTRSFNRPYLWPFIPFDGRSLAALLVRPPELRNKKRNPLLKPQQLDRLPDARGNR